MERDEGCGAVSPVIRPEGGGDPIAAWGGLHEWNTRTTVWFRTESESVEAHSHKPNEIFVAGTAILLRTAALQQTGALDDRLFAYYDDSDMGVRLAKGGWRSKVIFDATVEHGWRTHENLPLYFFYLIYRNEMIFWHMHSPEKYRHLLWLRLVDQAIYNAIQLKRRNLNRQSDAALLGIWDFIFRKYGRPQLDRKPSIFIRLVFQLSSLMHKQKLKKIQTPA
jgi:GT2 family glycosyltransferase